MANAFTLFGEITADTSKLQTGLNAVEQRLKGTKALMESTEKAGHALGQNTAVTNRQYEKLNQTLQAQRDRLNQVIDQYTAGTINAKQFAQALNQIDKATSGVNSKVRDTAAKLEDFAQNAKKADAALENLNAEMGKAPSKMQGFMSGLDSAGQKMTAAGAALTAGITAPLAGLAYASVKAAADMQSLEMGLTAVMGSADAAKAEMKALRDVAKLPGLGMQEALQGSINLQATGLSADTSRRALKAFGNALATVGKGKNELNGVITALSQIQSKGKVSAEEINQIAERVPQIRNVMKNAFGTADTEVLQKMKMDTDDFINGVVGQLEKLPQVGTSANGTFENLGDSIQMALLPVGQAILPILIDGINRLVPYVEKLSDWFASLSPTMQTVIIAVGAFAAAIGPALVIIGSIAQAIVAIQAAAALAAPAFAAVKAAILGVSAVALIKIIVVIAAIAAAAYLLYKAWDSNFAGIQDIAAAVADKLMAAWGAVKDFFVGLYNDIADEFNKFWDTNGADIQKAWNQIKQWSSDLGDWLKGVFQSIWDYIQPVVDAISVTLGQTFSGLWEVVKSVFKGIWDVISNVFMLIVHAINGDWDKAWQSAKNILSGVVDAILGILGGLLQMAMAPFRGLLSFLKGIVPDFMKNAIEIGEGMIDGIVNALKGGWQSIWDAAKTLGTAAIAAIKKTLGIASPSKVFFGIGKDTVQGYLDGLNSLKASVFSNVASIFDPKVMGKLFKGKAGEEVLKLFTGLIDKLAQYNAVTEESKLKLLFQTAAFKGLTEAQKEEALVRARAIDTINAQITRAEALTSAVEALKVAVVGERTEQEKLQALLADTDAMAQAAQAANMSVAAYRHYIEALIYLKKRREDATKAEADAAEKGKQLAGVYQSVAASLVQPQTELQKLYALLADPTALQAAADAAKMPVEYYERLVRLTASLATNAQTQEKAMTDLTAFMGDLGLATEKTVTFTDRLQAIMGNTTALDAMALKLGITTDQLKKMLEQEAKQRSFADATAKISDAMSKLGINVVATKTPIQELNTILADTTGLEAMAAKLGVTVEKLKEMIVEAGKAKLAMEGLLKPTTGKEGTGDGTGGQEGGGVIVTEWDVFFERFKSGMAQLKAELPSFSQALGDALVNFVVGVGDVFANAVRNWDGTWKGFFKSLKEGFANLVKDIIAQLVKLMVMKAIFKLLGSFGVDLEMPGAKTGGLVKAAAGGIIRGAGTGTSDSIPAMLSNGEYVIPAKAVKEYGVGFFDAIRSMAFTPTMAMAGGGFVSAPPVSTVSGGSNVRNTSNVFNISVSGSGNNQATGTMLQKQILEALKKTERRNR